MNRAGNPYSYVADPTKGRPLFNSDLYFGIPDLDPEIPANQVQVYLQQEDGTPVAVSQPIETGVGGVPMYNGSPAIILIDQDAYSFKALDRNGAQVYYQENAEATLGGGATVGSLENYAAVRALNGSNFTQVSVAGHTAAGDGGGGVFIFDPADTTTADNDVTVIVDAGGMRWKRRYTGPVDIRWAGASTSGTPSANTTAISLADSIGSGVSVSGGAFQVNTLSVTGVMEFASGSRLDIQASQTVTFSVDPVASSSQQIFSGAGSVAGLQESWPDWFGAAADGSTDDAGATNKAIASTAGVVWLREDAQGYRFASTLNLNKSITIDGLNRAKILSNVAIDFFTVSASDVTVQNLLIEGDATAKPNIFRLATNTASIERTNVKNILSTNCASLVYDDNHASNTAISTYFEDVQCRLVRGRGVHLRDAFAYLFFTRVSIDYVGVSDASTNVPAVNIVNNQGCVFDQVDILGGTIAGMASRDGFLIENSAAVFFTRCNADTMGGRGFVLTNIQGARLDVVAASLCDLHGIVINGNTYNLQGNNVYVGGRAGIGTPTATQHGINILGTSSDNNLTNVTTVNCTGDGVNGGGTSTFGITGLTSADNLGRGYVMSGTASLSSSLRLRNNTVGNYSLTGGLNHITSAQLNSGALVASATGPATA